jgi:hypothetical protein
LDDVDDEDSDFRDESQMMYEYEFDSPGSPKQSSILKVSKLLDNFLAEVALDLNLLPSKFIALAELLPDHARVTSDGLYRAVDIFLKVRTRNLIPSIANTMKNFINLSINMTLLP